ncbi:MAG: hypothetical protein JSW54_09425 [Fidelibacterota bacterium]|nr:MAG: hypothetical protein JSW54_09425 [Candidatus Neomarinimicrobiota bacterium]
MSAEKAHDQLIEKLQAIKALAEESEVLLRASSDGGGSRCSAPDVEKLMGTLQAQANLQQALLEKLLEVMNPTQLERDLSDTFQQAVQELMEYFRERVRLQSKVADAAALKHLRQE